MNISHEADVNGVLQVKLSGKPEGLFLDAFQAITEPGSRVVLDLHDAQALKGKDLEDLVWAHNRCLDEGGCLVLANVPHDLDYIISLLQLDQFFNIQQNVAEATQALLNPVLLSPRTTKRMMEIRRDQLKSSAPPGVDPDEMARQQVLRIKASMRYLAPTEQRVTLLQYLVEHGSDPLDEEHAAKALQLDPETIKHGLDRLSALRILVSAGGSQRFYPAPKVHDLIHNILRMWSDTSNRSKMLEWAKQEPFDD